MTAPTLADALRLIIQWNRDHATDQYGDPNKAESWACVRTARAALAAAASAVPQAQAVPVAWLRDQRGAYEGPAALEPLFLLGWNPPGPGRAATYSPLYAAQPAAPTSQPVQAVPLTPRDVARQVFALCEQFEDLQDSPADSFGVQRHIAGQRYAAKRIRNAIGDWLTEQERAHNITGGSEHG
jgi:hypothetical protein